MVAAHERGALTCDSDGPGTRVRRARALPSRTRTSTASRDTAEALLRAFSARDGTYARGSKPVVVVDVRTDAETRVSVIRGALTKRAFEARLDAGDFATHAVVAYCTIGYRSAQYVEKLRKEKDLDAYNLRGSVLAWTHAGGELETPEERRATTDVHVFGKDWDLAPSEFDAVYFQAPALSYVAGLVPDALKPWRWFKK